MKKLSKQLALIVTLIGILSLTNCITSFPYTVTNNFDDEFLGENEDRNIGLVDNFLYWKNGSQLNPYIDLKKDGTITSTGFFLANIRVDLDWLNIRRGDKIVFLADGKRISAKAIAGSIDSEVWSSTYGARKIYYDYATYILTKQQMNLICNASNLKVKVYGRTGRDEYGSDEKQPLNPSFYANNKRFFAENLLGK